jgi:hypothetical protein
MDVLDDAGSFDRCELNSHADTVVAGRNMVLLEASGETVQVSPYSPEYQPLSDIPIATCATAYDNPETGEVILLIFGQALYFGDRLATSLLSPNQIRDSNPVCSRITTLYHFASS